jgi:hypothetical protein
MDANKEDVFPNEDFFPDIDSLFSDMSLGGDNTNNGPSSAPASYVILCHLFQIKLQFLLLSIGLDSCCSTQWS